jgi:hypothetical protein
VKIIPELGKTTSIKYVSIQVVNTLLAGNYAGKLAGKFSGNNY